MQIGNYFRLGRIAKCSYFILSTQNIKFYWFVMKIKKFMLPIWWYNRGSFPLGNIYFGVFILNGLNTQLEVSKIKLTYSLHMKMFGNIVFCLFAVPKQCKDPILQILAVFQTCMFFCCCISAASPISSKFPMQKSVIDTQRKTVGVWG